MCGRGAWSGFDHDGALQDGRVVVSRNAEEMAACLEPGREGCGEGNESSLGVAGLNVLGGLGDVFGDDEFGE